MDADIRSAWTGLETLNMVSRDPDHGGPKSKVEIHGDIASLKDEKAARLQTYIRNHWVVENRCLGVLDTLFREDHNQTRQKNGAKNHSTLRHAATRSSNEPPTTANASSPAASRKNNSAPPKTKPNSNNASLLCRDTANSIPSSTIPTELAMESRGPPCKYS